MENTQLDIRKAAVLGSGVMGRGIAAHLAGAGIEVLLLDIVPPGEQSQDTDRRNAFAAAGLQAALKNKPALFFHPSDADRIRIGNFDDDLAKVSEVNWIIEVVKEDLNIKKALFEKLDALRKPGTLISSNTSGLPLADLIEGRSEDFKQNFIITHFFNPVRYLKLLEVVSGPHTKDGLIAQFEKFARQTLGKGVVYAKDSPAFVANRIGTFSMMYTVHRMLANQYTPEMVDAVFSEPMGRAKSGVFRTADVVGLDTLIAVTTHLYEDLPNDPLRDYFKAPDYLNELIAKKFLGSKSGKGCYQKVKEEISVFDPYTREYRPSTKFLSDTIKVAKKAATPGARVKAMISGADAAASFAWDCLAQTLCYAARNLNDIATDLVQVDNGMKWGFGQELGPFETWDAIGVRSSVERMKNDGYDVPTWVTDMLASGRESFYEGETGKRSFWQPLSASVHSEKLSPRFRRLPSSVDHPSLVAKNPGVRLWDIGDGVACVEFRTKMNAVDADITSMLVKAVELGQQNFDALIIGNHADAAFSAGANLMMIFMGAQQKQWDALRAEISGFQKAVKGLRESSIPVVAAPFGLTLGGGAEICLGASALQAHAELYMGLVEVGVGLIPGGGGCFGLLHNLQSKGPDIDPMVYLTDAFMTIAMAKVGTSAKESKALGFLNPADRITMDRDELLEAAKWHALGLARSDYQPSRNRKLKVAGTTGFGTLAAKLWDMEQSNQISAHDHKIALGLAKILSGGDVAMGTVVSEERFHELEQEVFLSLCGESKTQDRISYMLTNNKPLRN